MTTNLIACKDGLLSISSDGRLGCSGQFVSVTSDELGQKPVLTPEQSDQLIASSIILFATVFGFLCAKKILA